MTSISFNILCCYTNGHTAYLYWVSSQDHFPILGIGQGLEMLANLADRRSSFKNCPAANTASKLTMEPGELRLTVRSRCIAVSVLYSHGTAAGLLSACSRPSVVSDSGTGLWNRWWPADHCCRPYDCVRTVTAADPPAVLSACGRPGAARSRLLSGAGQRVRDILSSQPATVTFHGRCLSVAGFRSGQLARDFLLLASRDAGRTVSAIEHKRSEGGAARSLSGGWVVVIDFLALFGANP